MSWFRRRDGRRESLPLHHEEAGAGEGCIAFLPGIAGTTRYWAPRVAPLGRTHRLLFVDLLGYGRSPKPWTRYTVERHVQELQRVLQSRPPLTLVGHSFGAIVALAFAARHPAQVRGLVLIGLPYFGSEEGALRYFRNSRSADRYVMTNMAAIACVMTRRVLRWLLPFVLRDMPREVVEDLVLHTWRSYTSSVWDGMYRHDLYGDAARIDPRLPVLCLHGERDTTAPLSGVRRLVAAFPHWGLRVLPGCDHHPLLRDPAWCLQAIASVTAAGENIGDSGTGDGR